MIKIHFSLLLTGVFSLFIANANELNSTQEQNLSTFNLVKVNQHIITSDVLGAKKVHALIHKFTNSEKSAIIDQLINDEIAVQYTFNYLKTKDNINDEKERLSLGLKEINDIALEESIKSISDKNASDFYKANKETFWHEKHYEASHIMLRDKNITLDLLDTLAKASDYNATFKELAKKHSADRSAEKGGYLAHFPLKIMVEPFRDAIKSLKIGEHTTKPIRTRFGYHIISLHNIIPKGYFSFEEVKEEIKLGMAKRTKNKWFEKTLAPLKKKAKIDYLFDVNKTSN